MAWGLGFREGPLLAYSILYPRSFPWDLLLAPNVASGNLLNNDSGIHPSPIFFHIALLVHLRSSLKK